MRYDPQAVHRSSPNRAVRKLTLQSGQWHQQGDGSLRTGPDLIGSFQWCAGAWRATNNHNREDESLDCSNRAFSLIMDLASGSETT